MPVYITFREAARRVGCSDSTIRAAVRDGRLTAHRLPTIGEVRLSSREVARFRPRPVGKPKSCVK